MHIKNIMLFFVLIYSFISPAYQDGEDVLVGPDGQQITLKYKSVIYHGSFIASGNVKKIYNYGNNDIIYFFPIDKFKNTSQIEAIRIAGNLGVGPKFKEAFVTTMNDRLMVSIVTQNLVEGISVYVPKNIRNNNILIQDKMEEIFRQRSDGTTYFFDRIFNILKILAENKVSYGDLHWGNIMVPTYDLGDTAVKSFSYGQIKLIDFDEAEVHNTPQEAAIKTLSSSYVHIFIEMFERLSENKKGEVAKEAIRALRSMANGE